MKKFIIFFLIVVVLSGAVGLGFYIRSQTLNPRATIPNFFERLLSFFVNKGKGEDDDLLYYDTDISVFILNGSERTKVAVVGIVDKIAHQPDGDYHLVIRPPYIPFGLALITEFIPEITLPLPNVGDRIKIWGIVRFDSFHNWWELHPVIGWEIAH